MENEKPGDYTAAARSLAVRFTPQSVLCVGPADEALFGNPPELARLSSKPGLIDRLARLGRFELAFVSHTLEFLDRPEALAVLARLRDVHAPRVIVVLPRRLPPGARSLLDDNDLLALGFILAGAETDPARLALFDVADYKLTPDWLNPHFWANPERWDQAWW